MLEPASLGNQVDFCDRGDDQREKNIFEGAFKLDVQIVFEIATQKVRAKLCIIDFVNRIRHRQEGTHLESVRDTEEWSS